MQKQLLFTISVAALLGASQVLPAQAAPAASLTKPASGARPWVNTVKDEHLKPQASTGGAAHPHHAITAQEPTPAAGRGGLSTGEQAGDPTPLARRTDGARPQLPL